MKIKVYIAEVDSEIEFEAKMEVCHDCEGHGTVLCEGMRGHAYTAEEFAEFEEEEAREYMTRGGRYDVQCPTCKGANVIKVVDRDKTSEENLKLLDDQEEDDYQYRMMCEAERRAGC